MSQLATETEVAVGDPVGSGSVREIEVRRRGDATGAVGVAGCLMALAWFVRATSGGGVADWVISAATLAIGVTHLLAMLDARTPVLVADQHGLRVRRGTTWQGVTWRQVARIEHRPRRGLLRDGALLVEPSVGAADAEKPLRLALTLSTRVRGTDDLTAGLRELAGDDVTVEEVRPAPAPAGDDRGSDGPGAEDGREDDETGAGRPAARRPAAAEPVIASSTPLPLRELVTGTRADVVLGATALRLDPAEDDTEGEQSEAGEGERGAQQAGSRAGRLRAWLPEARELRREGSVNLVEDPMLWGERVRPIARPGEAVDPLVLDDHPAQPAVEPVIGPELAAARTRLGLSVDQLAERTRIRPHVIESIEVDDFAPCGGDFYARGHLRTLARVLGTDATPLLESYDERYADAPIDPRRVFEAELATGVGGSIRGTRGGPNWSVLVAAVMTVVLVWSVARLVTDGPASVTPPTPRLNSSGGVDNGVSAGTGAAVPVVLTAATGGAQVIVRSGSEVVFDDQMAFMQTVQLDVAPPVRISSTDGGLTVTVDGTEEGALGETGQDAQDIFVP